MTAIQRTVLKHPGSAYFIVAFVALCCTVVVRSALQALIYLLPLAAACYVGRTATIVDDEGVTARALLGSRLVPWSQLRGLLLADKGAVYAVSSSGTRLRLPCVRATKLGPLIVAGGGRIPDPSQPPPAEAEPENVQPENVPPENVLPGNVRPEPENTEPGYETEPDDTPAHDEISTDR